MIFSELAAFLLLAAGIVLLLGLTPEIIGRDAEMLFRTKDTLKEKAGRVLGKIHTPALIRKIREIREALTGLGKEKTFRRTVAVSVMLLLAGSVMGFLADNVFLSPVLAAALAALPFAYVRRNLASYDRKMKEETEAALSAVTSSYLLNDDLVEAVRENLPYLRPPVKGIFEEFVTEATSIRPDLDLCILHLKEKSRDKAFGEYCDVLLRCQKNRNMKETLPSVVEKYTDLRIINSELEQSMKQNRKEYLTMVFLTLGNIPLLRLLNEDWYLALTETPAGKAVIALTGLVILITAYLCAEYTRPLEYGRRNS